MSGHSKWHNIKEKKGVADARRAKAFTQLARLITMAAKKGGADPKYNFALRLAVDRAREASVPRENIERAIKKGTGELAGEELSENRYEGYGPGGVAVIVDTVTDNPNRTVADLKHLFSKNGGNLGGSVVWQFESKGIIHIVGASAKAQDDTWMLEAIETGMEDAQADEQDLIVITQPQQLQKVKEWVEGQGVKIESAQIVLVPKEQMPVADEETKKTLQGLLDALEEMDDVTKVYHNASL
jgi:YebC/PmpR family DNA-binding regulatory protein